jgi:threonine/homoserine/homoserine lactone efflux protein
MSAAQLTAFFGVAIVVIVTPGQDTALTIRNTLAGGVRGGVLTAAGVATAQSVWTLLTSLGLAALLIASEPAFLALKVLGCAYLAWLGANALYSAIRGGRAHERGNPSTMRLRARTAYRRGVVSNLGNPKMAVFFTSLLPQFGPQPAPFLRLLALGLAFCATTLAWLSFYAVAVDRLGGFLRRRPVRRLLDAVTGTVLLAFGARLALSRD